MFKKILCAVDFSRGSQQALHTATLLAKQLDAELVVMHAWHVPPLGLGDFPFPPAASRQIADDARRALDAAVTEAEAAGVKRVTSEVLHGAPGPTIVAAAEGDNAIDVLVVGTHGHGRLARVFLGSTADYVVHHAPCPVLVVRDPRVGREVATAS